MACQTIKLSHRLAHPQHGALEILRKEMGLFPPGCTKQGVDSNEHRWTSCQTRGFVHDVPASGVAMIPDGNYREAGARYLRSAKAEATGTVQ